jgi:hypothetical protein
MHILLVCIPHWSWSSLVRGPFQKCETNYVLIIMSWHVCDVCIASAHNDVYALTVRGSKCSHLEHSTWRLLKMARIVDILQSKQWISNLVWSVRIMAEALGTRQATKDLGMSHVLAKLFCDCWQEQKWVSSHFPKTVKLIDWNESGKDSNYDA